MERGAAKAGILTPVSWLGALAAGHANRLERGWLAQQAREPRPGREGGSNRDGGASYPTAGQTWAALSLSTAIDSYPSGLPRQIGVELCAVIKPHRPCLCADARRAGRSDRLPAARGRPQPPGLALHGALRMIFHLSDLVHGNAITRM